MSFENQNSKESNEAPKSYLKQAESLIPDRFKADYYELKALVDEGEKRNILSRQSGNPQKAADTAAFAIEKKDPDLLNNYMWNLDESKAGEVDSEAQLALLEAAKKTTKYLLSNPDTSVRDFDEARAIFEEIGAKLPDARDELTKEFEDKLQKGFFDSYVPAYVSAYPIEQQQQIYKMNPEDFAKSFPDSQLVQGDTLQELLDQDVYLLSKKAMDLKDSYSGRNASVLKNPNLSPKQLAQITDAFVQIGYDANPERNPDYFEATQNVLRVYNGIKHHPNTSPATKKKLQDRFDKALSR